jgi:hypothetical protein
MLVELHDSLLDGNQPQVLTILGICAFAFAGRHEVCPNDRARWNEWASSLPRDLEEELKLAWDISEERSSVGSQRIGVEVTRTKVCHLRGKIARLNPESALTLLGRPLRILVENGRNDRAFLLAFSDSSTRRALLDAEKQGWLVFETAGGISEILERLRSVCDMLGDDIGDAEAFRTLYLCDSDSREAGCGSPMAHEVLKYIQLLHKAFHRHLTASDGSSRWLGWVLSRRAAENYAPPPAVLNWAAKKLGRNAHLIIESAKSAAGKEGLCRNPGDRNSARRRLLAAIALNTLPNEVRDVLCFKQGRGEGPNFRTDNVVWQKLSEFQAAALVDGFGQSFSSEFYGSTTELCDSEISGVVSNILGRL